MAVFYQVYRPLKFSDVIGQEAIVKVLVNSSKNGQLAHAYLFTGSRGVGKTTLARIIAKATNCPKIKNGEPCGKCEVCSAIGNGTFLDVVEIDAASHTGVDNVRELIEHMQFKPTRGAMKVFIIDEVHMLSKAAFNALLKTLEEPPAHAMFILATTDIEKVPETIISRTQRLDFRKISYNDIVQQLKNVVKAEKLSLPKGTVELIAENAEGGMRDALSLLGVASSLGEGASIDDVRALLGITPMQVIRNLLDLIVNKQSSNIPSFFAEQEQLGIDFLVFNKGVLECLRLLLLDHMVNPQGTFKDELSKKFTLSQLLLVIRLFLRSYKEISHAPSAELPVLLAAIEASMGFEQRSQPVVNDNTTVPSQPSPKIQESVGTQDDKPAKTTAVKTNLERPFNEIIKPGAINDEVAMEEFLQWWPDAISKIRATNGTLAILLKNSPVQAVQNGIITIGVKYLFHKENIESIKNTELIRERIFAISGKRMSVKAVISKDDAQASESDPVAALGDALKMFGGELVE